jgi:hypothetical protein
MNRFLKLVAILAILAAATGCTNRATASVSPGTDLSMLKTMYVKKLPADKETHQLIANKLSSKGVKVTTGEGDAPGNVDAIITYMDKWMWDMTMYMLELTININDPKSGAQLATGNSLHTSLTRKSPPAMVDEVVENIYKAKK